MSQQPGQDRVPKIPQWLVRVVAIGSLAFGVFVGVVFPDQLMTDFLDRLGIAPGWPRALVGPLVRIVGAALWACITFLVVFFCGGLTLVILEDLRSREQDDGVPKIPWELVIYGAMAAASAFGIWISLIMTEQMADDRVDLLGITWSLAFPGAVFRIAVAIEWAIVSLFSFVIAAAAVKHGNEISSERPDAAPGSNRRSVMIGSREVVVRTDPLRASKPTMLSVLLPRPTDQTFVLKPFSPVVRGLGLRLSIVGVLAFLLGLKFFFSWGATGPVPKGFPLVTGGALMLVGSFFLLIGVGGMIPLGRRFELDVGAGLLRTCWDVAGRRLSRRRERPLREVLAIQLLVDPAAPWSTKGRNHHQLNLVLDGQPLRRINLGNGTDRRATQEMAVELAAFLRVPLLDEASAETQHP